jgi:hypothetical protein
VRGAAEPADDPQAALVVRKGHEHEATCLAGLKERCGDFVEIPSGALKTRFAATVYAMERGVPLIYQAALTTGAWLCDGMLITGAGRICGSQGMPIETCRS